MVWRGPKTVYRKKKKGGVIYQLPHYRATPFAFDALKLTFTPYHEFTVWGQVTGSAYGDSIIYPVCGGRLVGTMLYIRPCGSPDLGFTANSSSA